MRKRLTTSFIALLAALAALFALPGTAQAANGFPDGTFTIVATGGVTNNPLGLCVGKDSTFGSDYVLLEACTLPQQANQTWQYDAATQHLVLVSENLCADVRAEATGERYIYLNPCSSAATQKWIYQGILGLPLLGQIKSATGTDMWSASGSGSYIRATASGGLLNTFTLLPTV
ncbi:MAG TPA: ricin-type beta-trefoil lectin domain protein [Streptomyces sp.]|uniref:ricin-type beta-trefoil lectin domain protein n=1 Tax=Streptomyces sp. TaxID=1931 RepID=UPI002BD1D103|nr:ricin-type beta-trefoil lectin domain protein [Streptomyces sp.]HWU08612.1 ricin-type beta-trefoil lectin domain protein [Streptomyces sp.]